MGACRRGAAQPADRRFDGGRSSGVSRWPMWRTMPRPLLEEGVSAYFISLVTAWLCLIGIMTVVVVVGSLFRTFNVNFHIAVNFFGMAVFMAALCCVGFILALPFLLLCIKNGRAGLISAIGIGVTIAFCMGQIVFQPEYTVPPLVSVLYGGVSGLGSWYGLHRAWPTLQIGAPTGKLTASD